MMRPRKRTNKNYILIKDDGFSLKEIEEFALPKKIYGDINSKADRVLTTFRNRVGNLGVLLSGIKGNSKTTLAKVICNESNKDVITITEPYTGSEFKDYLSTLGESVIFIDEFEKVYSTTELQQEFLTILDGVMGGNKLFIFTSNSTEINTYLRNRPSRIFYHFKFDNLEEEVVNDIINTELKDKSFEEDLRAVLTVLGSISIDVLLNFIDEVNRFKKSPRELIKGLNIEVEQVNFSVVLLVKGGRFETKCSFNPLTREEFFLDYKDERGYYSYHTGKFSEYTMYTTGGSFIFENEKEKIVFTPYKPFKFEL